MDGFWKAVTSLGNVGWFWIALGIVLLCFKKTRPAAITALLSLALCFLITNVFLKNVVARVRPYDAYSTIIPLIAKPHDFSFPSGHTCASFACSLIYVRMLPKKYGISLVVLSCLIAFSRLYLGVHYPGDVLGGFLIALAGSALVYRIMKPRLEKINML